MKHKHLWGAAALLILAPAWVTAQKKAESAKPVVIDEVQAMLEEEPAAKKTSPSTLQPTSGGKSASVQEERTKLQELFSPEKNPGSGTLVYKQGAASEPIEFGAKTGRYLLGMVFSSEALPPPFPEQFKKGKIIQIVMGTPRSRLQGQVPQFGSVSLITKAVPTRRAVYRLVVPTGKSSLLEEVGLLLFGSPLAKAEQTDEDKLKNTYFAEEGYVTLIPNGKARIVELKSQGRVLLFKAQMFDAELTAKLVTPFNAQENSLSGKIQLPIYWPHGRDAHSVARRIASESFSGMATLSPPPTEKEKGKAKDNKE